MVIEVVMRIVAVRPTVPAVRAALTTTGPTSPAGTALSLTASTQAGQSLGDGLGGIRLGVVRVWGHLSILHAT